ncbi:Uncharacterised protein [Mycoplasmopsis maculosa]|uniref:Uncharacterized protein n=1 Tax=Mycoplasmopsis maculosa TaxID=114885 RepID=A0A449B4Q4_9BACT|nr:hypothetical protein [Mycoplasmopsis maculosa]VEU75587.1 Uncharacterised protein [Mycoplasmopsis maculosa]
MAEYLDLFPNHDSKFYNDEYIVIKNIEEFEEIYKYSKISELNNKRNYYKSFYKRIEHLKNDSELHSFFKKEFENDFLIGAFYEKNKKRK